MIASTQATTVRAAVAAGTGSPDVLAMDDVELPALTAGQLRAHVTYAGVNFWDIMQRRGIVSLPDTRVPGVEGVGIVEAVGEAVDQSLIGQRVAWSKVTGSYADAVQGDAGWFLPVPDGMTDEVAAAVLMQGVTADYLIEAAPTIGQEEVAVVMAAAGGVGTMLTQMLTTNGVRVAGVVSRQVKATTAEAAGADCVLIDGDDLVDRFLDTYPAKARAVFDGNGGPQMPRGFEMLAPRGGMVLFGSAAGPLPDLDMDVLGPGSLSVQRVAAGNFVGDQSSWEPRARRVMDAAKAGTLTPHIDRIVQLNEVARQHEYLESRRSTGKLLIDPTT